MNNLIARSAAIGLVAAFAAVPALAATPLLDFSGETVGNVPSFGTSFGLLVVDDGSFSGADPSAFDASVIKQLYLDIAGTTNFGVVQGLYTVPFPPLVAAASVFQMPLMVAAPTTFSFSYNVLTNLPPGAVGDFFAAGLISGSGTTVLSNSLDTSGYVLSSSGFGWESGIKTVTFDVMPGSYTVEFVMGTTQSGCATGGLCIPSGVVIAAIPEPGTYVMFAAGLLALGVFVRRRRQG
jgi:hypothetical protein